MNLFLDIAHRSLNKFGEELCGDMVEVVKENDITLIVLSDGLGSGVKANILSTLTIKIAATMLKNGESIYETVKTIINTLPICNVRKIAYSTFTILIFTDDNKVSIAEYDNPPLFIHRNNKTYNLDKEQVIIADKKIKLSSFVLEKGDVITAVSDGVIHAGIGQVLNLGWQWEEVDNYLKKSIKIRKSSGHINNDLLQVCWDLYGGKPGDDTTVVTIKARNPEYVDLFTGPPEDKAKDCEAVGMFMKGEGKKIISGGTAANIVSRELHRDLIINIDEIDEKIPPTAFMYGIDLVTEGVLTISKAIDLIKTYNNSYYKSKVELALQKENGAAQMAKILIEDCTHFKLWVGKAINPAHQNPDFPQGLNIKLNLVNELIEEMTKMGKHVEVNYI